MKKSMKGPMYLELKNLREQTTEYEKIKKEE
jgi:hypothetical protein